MQKLAIQGGIRLNGEVHISGAKNAALPIMCAGLLTRDELHLDNMPDLHDVATMRKLLVQMGMSAVVEPSAVTLCGAQVDKLEAPYEMVKTMRAAILVLEEWEGARQRGAQCLAELVGYGLSTDISHLTHPSIEGQARAMQRALQDAGMEAGEIDYINAHGTGTQANDAVESAAIRSVFGSHAGRLAVSSTKSMHGHLLGAAGALELVASVMAMRAATLPPTMHLHMEDPECDLDYVPLVARRVAQVRAVMSNSFAFGGTDAVLVARNVDA